MALSVLAVKCIFLVVIFVSTLGFTLIPFQIIPQNKNKILPRKSTRIISFCNCFAGGVFLSTLLVGLIPFVRAKFEETFLIKQITVNYPVTEATILLGFFVNLLAEKSVILIQSWRGNSRKKTNVKPLTKKTPARKSTKQYTIVTSSSDTDDDGVDAEDSEEEILNGSATTNLTPAGKPKSGHSHHHHHHHHHHDEAHSGHGHSHMPVGVLRKSSGLRCILLVLAMSIHGLFEGLAVGLQDQMEPLVGLYIAVIVHECLVSFAMGVSIARQKLRSKTMFLIALCLCLMIPIGMGAGIMLGSLQGFVGGIVNAVVQGIAGGTFLYVIFLEILPPEIESEEDHGFKLAFLMLGALLIACLRVLIS